VFDSGPNTIKIRIEIKQRYRNTAKAIDDSELNRERRGHMPHILFCIEEPGRQQQRITRIPLHLQQWNLEGH
jgi:hypothetical protein